MNNVVAIVGRPNVGKSTLYNRLIGEKEAIIDNVPGVTRDRLYGTSEWNGAPFTVIDTGGFVHGSADVFEAAIRRQVKIAIDEANAIIFMVDVTTGITDIDEEIADILRRGEKPVILAVNKVDNNQRMIEANEFWSLGFEETFFLSSISGSGSGELHHPRFNPYQIHEVRQELLSYRHCRITQEIKSTRRPGVLFCNQGYQGSGTIGCLSDTDRR